MFGNDAMGVIVYATADAGIQTDENGTVAYIRAKKANFGTTPISAISRQ
jgi:hypothetical protein